jgi:transmembrane sensor
MPGILDKKKLHIKKADGKSLPKPDVPVENAWDNMKQLLQQSPAAPAAESGSKIVKAKRFNPFVAGTGIVITVAVLTYVIATKKEHTRPPKLLYSSDSTPRADTLQDGTIAFLDTLSSIGVINQIDKGKLITLNNGGCYFRQLNKNPDTPCQLKVGPVTIFPNNANMYVSIDTATATAIVQVQTGNAEIQLDGRKLQLAAGESMRLNTRTDVAHDKQKLNPNLFSYANKVFEFSNTSFKEAAGFIEKAYGVKIIVNNPKLYNCTITTRFDNKSLEEILDILGYTLAFDYKIDKKRKQVIISGDGCD